MHEDSALSTSDGAKCLREGAQFLRECLPRTRARDAAREASVEHLQELARIRLCLDRAAEVLAELREGSGKSSPHPSSPLLGDPVVWRLGECGRPVLGIIPASFSSGGLPRGPVSGLRAGD